ncbi:Uncharacterised protein [Vibrio cholerae]|nr:Uncharacterised protein [Vibrio cholerae]
MYLIYIEASMVSRVYKSTGWIFQTPIYMVTNSSEPVG